MLFIIPVIIIVRILIISYYNGYHFKISVDDAPDIVININEFSYIIKRRFFSFA